MLHEFSRQAPAPDPASTVTAITAVIGPDFRIWPSLNSDGSITVLVDKPTAWSAADITGVQAAITAAPVASKPRAQQNDIDAMPIALEAVVLALIDQLNVIRAALPTPLPAITRQQALTAIRNKAGQL